MRHMNASTALPPFGWSPLRFAVAVLVISFMCTMGAAVGLCSPADAQASPTVDSRPSVLVVDSGLGDYVQCTKSWLGEDLEGVASNGGTNLVTTAAPAWWSDSAGPGDAPSTFVLGSSDSGSAISAEDVVWALDQIGKSGKQPKSFVVASGPAGIKVCEYAQDLATEKQSQRADIVGLALCGVPVNGYSGMGEYPEPGLWDTLAQSAGLSRTDIAPGSQRLQVLSSSSLPRASKNLVLEGNVGDLGFGYTDGAGTRPDFALAEAVSAQVQTETVDAVIAQGSGLSSQWSPLSDEVAYGSRAVDAQLAERFVAMYGYETSAEVQDQVHAFYDAWFGQSAPVTHNSSVLALDLSGSMNERLGSGESKLDAARVAAQEYLQAVEACDSLPLSAPADTEVIGFNENLLAVADGYDTAARSAVGAMRASKETNIEIALEAAVDSLSDSPTNADRHVLLLSDGASTRGADDEQLLTGIVAQAAKKGIVIDAVGFGDVGESNAAFLKNVANATGGSYYPAENTFVLKVSFLKSHYASMGLDLTEEEFADASMQTGTLCKADGRTGALDMAVVTDGEAPSVKLLRDGSEVDQDLYSVKAENGLASLQYVDPAPGEYSLSIAGSSGSKHVFAVTHPGISKAVVADDNKTDLSEILLGTAGVLLIAAVAFVLIRAGGKKRAQA